MVTTREKLKAQRRARRHEIQEDEGMYTPVDEVSRIAQEIEEKSREREIQDGLEKARAAKAEQEQRQTENITEGNGQEPVVETEKSGSKAKKKKTDKPVVGHSLDQPFPRDDERIISWGCKIERNSYLRFSLLAAKLGVTKSELLIRIIEAEKLWVAAHPEFPSTEFIIENIKNKKEPVRDAVSVNFPMQRSSSLFVKSMAARCSMKMYMYLNWIIEKYCDEYGIERIE